MDPEMMTVFAPVVGPRDSPIPPNRNTNNVELNLYAWDLNSGGSVTGIYEPNSKALPNNQPLKVVDSSKEKIKAKLCSGMNNRNKKGKFEMMLSVNGEETIRGDVDLFTFSV